MNLYRVYNLTFRSNVRLPELMQQNGKEPDCAFQLHSAREHRPISCDWFHHRRLPDGKIWLSLAKQAPGYLLHFPDLADFVLSADGKDIRCFPIPGIPSESIRHLLLDQVIPLLLTLRGKLVLHASAVVARKGAIVFLSTTGQGKSTLAASFCKQGFPLLTDDCLLLEEKVTQLLAFPSYPGLRIWPDVSSVLLGPEPMLFRVAHYTEKKRVALDDGRLPFCPDPVPLSKVYVLASSDEMGDASAIAIAPLSPRDTFIELVKCSTRLDITDRKRLTREFEYLTGMTALPLFCSLTFPRDLSLLPKIREAILADLEGEERLP